MIGGVQRTLLSLGLLAAQTATAGRFTTDVPAPAQPAPVQRALEQPAESAAHLKVGTLTLHRCETRAPWCGTLDRPLDPAGKIADRISIYFEFYPHTRAGPSRSTLVAAEGGPGYPATESRDEYLAFFAPLRARRDVLLMDNRGTGRSGAIDCIPLQTDPAITEDNVAACGRQLGQRAGLYSTALAADDLAALLDALQLGAIDLYGDSSGTFFEQVFAVRHPDRLRSLVLDGAYPLSGLDYAWYPNYAPAMRDKFNLACKRSDACRRLGGSSLDHIAPALDSLRRAPVAAEAHDGNGNVRNFTADATQLATVMFGSAPAYASVRELDAAARAFTAGDRAPLLRLMAETQVGVDSRDETRSPARFSSGLAAAITCHDAPQIFDMSVPPSSRVSVRDAAIAERARVAPQTYAPFTIDEYRAMPLDYAFIDECARWPVVPKPVHGSVDDFANLAYPDVPALVISGDLDNMTPVADGTMVARKFARSYQLVVPDGLHVNALPHSRSDCPAEIARAFIETLRVTSTSCLHSIPEIRLVPRFARRAAELAPAQPTAGNAASDMQLRVVAAAVLTVGDVIGRLGSNTSGRGVGLRGGEFTVEERQRTVYRLSLQAVQWTEDVSISGTLVWPEREGPAFADLVVSGQSGLNGALQIRWIEGTARARAGIRGRLGEVAVAAETPAP